MKISTRAIGMIEYLVVLIPILDCHTVYSQTLDKDYRFPEIFIVLIAVLFVIKVAQQGIRKKPLTYWGIVFTFYYIILIFYALISVSSVSLVMFCGKLLVCLPLLCFIFGLYMDEGKPLVLFVKYVDIMTVISAISLFFWVFSSQLHIIANTGYTTVDWGGIGQYPSYFGLYFERQWGNILNFIGLRNQGIFCEGPMFSLCLVFAIAIELFFGIDKSQATQWHIFRKRGKIVLLKEKRAATRKGRLAILIITLITTMTTTGFILLVGMISVKFILNKPKEEQIVFLKAAVAVLVIIFAIALIIEIFNRKASSGSWNTRVDDYKAGFRTWLESPVWGSGFSDGSKVQAHMSSFRKDNLGYSNSIFEVLAEGGIMLFSVYGVPLIGSAILFLKKGRWELVAFVFVIMIEFIVTVFTYKLLMIMLLAFCYAVIITTLSNMDIEKQL